LTVEPVSPEIDEEVELRRDGEAADDVNLTLPLPITARFGIRYVHVRNQQELFDVELDVGYASWSRVDRLAVDTHGLVANLLGQQMDLGVIEVDKQWRDTFSVHLGGDYAVLPGQVSVRGGVLYESAVADPRYAGVDFVTGQQLGGAVGGSVFIGSSEIALTYGYRHQPALQVTEGEARGYQQVPGSQCEAPYTDPDLCHPQYLGRPSPAVNAGRYRAHQHEVSVDWLYRF
jgi:hypothetical protein